MEDVAITSRELVQAMYDPETERADVEGIRQYLREERLIEVPQAVATKKRHDATIKIYCRVLWGIIAAAVPLSIAKEIWLDLWLTWLIAVAIWSVIVATMLALFFLLTRDEGNAAVWTIGRD